MKVIFLSSLYVKDKKRKVLGVSVPVKFYEILKPYVGKKVKVTIEIEDESSSD